MREVIEYSQSLTPRDWTVVAVLAIGSLALVIGTVANIVGYIKDKRNEGKQRTVQG